MGSMGHGGRFGRKGERVVSLPGAKGSDGLTPGSHRRWKLVPRSRHVAESGFRQVGPQMAGRHPKNVGQQPGACSQRGLEGQVWTAATEVGRA